MKRVYITPEIKTLQYRTLNFFAASPTSTEWHTGTEGTGDDDPIGGDQPDPNADSRWLKQSMWDEE